MRAKRNELRIKAGSRLSIGSEKVISNEKSLSIQEIANLRA